MFRFAGGVALRHRVSSNPRNNACLDPLRLRIHDRRLDGVLDLVKRRVPSGRHAGAPNRPESIHLVTPAGKLRDLAEPSFSAVQEGLAWSPDSRRIAYSGHSGDGNLALWVMNRDGSDRRQLTFPTLVEPRGSGGDHIGAWSPDGARLLYSSYDNGGFELWVINADGSGAYRLTDWAGGDSAGTWLRSGEIVFAHFTGDEPLPKWYIVPPDGTGLRSLPWFSGAGDPLDWVQPR